MSCYKHPNMNAVAKCANCGRDICAICTTRVGDAVVCRDCAEELRSRPAPPEAEPASEAGAPLEPSAPAPSPGAVAAAPPAPVVATPSRESMAAADVAAAGGRRKKESLLSALLSLVLPGAGQAYNGQPVKGVLLAAVYVGLIVAIIGSSTLLAIVYPLASCCCLPAYIAPLIILLYAVYNAYRTAEKINSGVPAIDWL